MLWSVTKIFMARMESRRGDEVDTDESECSQNLELRWMSEMQSSVYATPLITDLFSDGHKDIVVPSFVHHLEVMLRDLHVDSKLPSVSTHDNRRSRTFLSSAYGRYI